MECAGVLRKVGFFLGFWLLVVLEPVFLARVLFGECAIGRVFWLVFLKFEACFFSLFFFRFFLRGACGRGGVFAILRRFRR